MKRLLMTAACGFLLGTLASAQESVPLMRDEVSVYKKKMVAMLEALGEAPAGYTKEREDFSLPTEASPARMAGRFNPVNGSASRSFGTEKAASKANEEMSKDYQKKIMDAQARGDYEAVSKLSMEMQQKVTQANAKAMSGHKDPIEVSVHCNSYSGGTIDPDAVVLEKPGIIALKQKDGEDSDRGTVTIYCDPVSLKDTRQLSSVRLNPPEDGIAKRNAVKVAVIIFHGPLTEIEPWVKRIDVNKIVAQID
jgi:hypothetical protein